LYWNHASVHIPCGILFSVQKIAKIENLNHLHELRVLNIAANKIKTVENLHGLHSLLEFNLRRNNINDIVSNHQAIGILANNKPISILFVPHAHSAI
jgi:hypothetical protein